jgi:hypothetical protein
MSRTRCSSLTRRTLGRSGLGRALARISVSSLTELINLLNLSRGDSLALVMLPSLIQS